MAAEQLLPRPPYLLALIRESDAEQGADVEELRHYGWDGYHLDGRWIGLQRSGERAMSCLDVGYQLYGVADESPLPDFWALLKSLTRMVSCSYKSVRKSSMAKHTTSRTESRLERSCSGLY